MQHLAGPREADDFHTQIEAEGLGQHSPGRAAPVHYKDTPPNSDCLALYDGDVLITVEQAV